MNAAVERHLQRTLSASDASSKFDQYKERVAGASLSNREARAVAKEIVGEEVGWDWDLPRTKEGYYHYRGGMAVRVRSLCVLLRPPWTCSRKPGR